MRREIAERWTAALRSGEYKQGQNQLRDPLNKTFCCFGVLCDLAAQDGFGRWEHGVFKTGPLVGAGSEIGDVATISNKVRAWAGLSIVDGGASFFEHKLMRLNDEGQSFEQIARMIDTLWRDL